MSRIHMFKVVCNAYFQLHKTFALTRVQVGCTLEAISLDTLSNPKQLGGPFFGGAAHKSEVHLVRVDSPLLGGGAESA